MDGPRSYLDPVSIRNLPLSKASLSFSLSLTMRQPRPAKSTSSPEARHASRLDYFFRRGLMPK